MQVPDIQYAPGEAPDPNFLTTRPADYPADLPWPPPKLSPLGVAALGYALGYDMAVFPLDGKVPFKGTNGFKDASRDPEQLIRWWTRWPTANIGIATGKLSGVVVVDTDGEEGEVALRDLVATEPLAGSAAAIADAESYLRDAIGNAFDPASPLGREALRAFLGETPLDTLTVATGKQGRHYYFAYPSEGFPNTVGKLGPKLDTRGDGGYVVGAPSIHPVTKRAYAVLHIGPRGLRPVPPAILKALAPAPERKGAIVERIGEGARNATLTSFAGTMRRRGATEGEILAALSVMNAERCDPPLAEREVEEIARSVARYAPAPDTEHLTDLGNARRLVGQHGADLRHVQTWRGWLVWDGRRWTDDDTGEVERRAKAVVRELYARAAQEPDAGIAKALARFAGQCSTDARINSMLALAATEPEVALRGGDFDRDPWLLNVANGTLDLRTGALRLHRPEDRITKQAPVAFDPAAAAPRWERFLDEIMAGDAEMISFLQRAVGYGLTGDTGEECLFFFHGSGANGKTKFLETVRALLGDYALNANFAMLLDLGKRSSAAASPDVARLRGARFVTAIEAPGGKPFDETVVKQVVGGDTLTARHLYHEEFEFVPAFKLYLAANHKPPVREQTEAFWRRMRLVPFTVTIPEEARDPDLLAKLKAELPGILNWALAGCAAWRDGGLRPPAAVTQATAAYREDNDVIAEWVGACAVIDPKAWTANGDLYKSYVEWRFATYGNEDRPLNPTWFGRLLGERPDLVEEKRGQRGRRGIRLVMPLAQGDF